MKVEEKTETFNGVTSEKLYMTLRKKGEQNTQVVRCTGTIAKALTGRENYFNKCKDNNFFIMNKGERISANNVMYYDFDVKSRKKTI